MQQTGMTGSARGEADATPADVVDRAPMAARKAADKAQDAVRGAMDMAQEQASQRLADQVNRGAETLASVSQALTAVAEELRSADQAPVASVADRAAEQVDRAATYLRGKDLDQLVAETERFARRQPAVFVGGAFALGILAARFLKASAPEEDMPPSRYRRALPPPSAYRPPRRWAPQPYGAMSTAPGAPRRPAATSSTRSSGTAGSAPRPTAAPSGPALRPSSTQTSPAGRTTGAVPTGRPPGAPAVYGDGPSGSAGPLQ